jgi:hypothetical protein
MSKRRIVALFFPQLGVECFEKKSGGRLNATVLLYGEENAEPTRINEGQRLDALSADLYAYGVYPSMRIRSARRLFPAIDVQRLSRSVLEQRMHMLAELCVPVSPAVAIHGNMIFVDITGCPFSTRRLMNQLVRLLKDSGHQCLLTVNSHQRWAAAWARDVFFRAIRETHASAGCVASRICTAEPSRRNIQEISLLALPIPPSKREELQSLGVQCLRELKELSTEVLSTCLQENTKEILRFFGSGNDVPVQIFMRSENISESAEFEFGIGSLEPFRFALKPVCQRLMYRLKIAERTLVSLSMTLLVVPGWAAQDVADCWESEPQTLMAEVDFPVPLADADGLLRVLMGRLEHMDIGGQIEEIVLEAKCTKKRESTQSAFMWRDDGLDERAVRYSIASLVAELKTEPGNQVGCLRQRGEILPEDMSELAVPSCAVSKNALHLNEEKPWGQGRFMDQWPWPTHMLAAPRLSAEEGLSKRLPFGVLEGITAYNKPYIREYQIVTFADRRCALGFADPETNEFWIQGWFN